MRLPHDPQTTSAYFAFVSAFFTVISATPIPGCPNPMNKSSAQLRKMWSRHSSSPPHDSFYMIAPYRGMIQGNLSSTGNDSMPDMYRDDIECPERPSNEPDLRQRSTCPWFNVFNYDPDRYPDQIAEAVCSCYDCIGRAGHRCEHVNYYARVLRKNPNACDQEGYYRYDVGYEIIRVGCTCAMQYSV